jgi:hypothetical protein
MTDHATGLCLMGTAVVIFGGILGFRAASTTLKVGDMSAQLSLAYAALILTYFVGILAVYPEEVVKAGGNLYVHYAFFFTAGGLVATLLSCLLWWFLFMQINALVNWYHLRFLAPKQQNGA